ncbi:MAG: hypothetical protein CL920_28875 [Deltaproteobacteria bacterium]|nr:hypothetical protein [Deltaproteobacteria bacterium]MBU52723.1 hypothetical protein [Deltaproteobacteria bacterium]
MVCKFFCWLYFLSKKSVVLLAFEAFFHQRECKGMIVMDTFEEKKQFIFDKIEELAVLHPMDYHRSMRARSGGSTRWLIDLRRLFLRSDTLDCITDVFWDIHEEKMPFQVGGLEVGAIPLVTAIVMKAAQRGINVNSFLVRKERKTSGLCNQIEGLLNEHPILVVDDLIHSGSSVERVRLALEQEERKITEAFFLIDYQVQRAREWSETHNIPYRSLFGLDEFSLVLSATDRKTWPQPNLECLWYYQAKDPNYVFNFPNSAPVCDQDHVYFGSDDHFVALNRKNGYTSWEYKTGRMKKGIFSSPLLHNGRVYFGAYDGNVYCLQAKTGKLVWRHTESDFIGSSPAYSAKHNMIYIGAEYQNPLHRGALLALDADTGKQHWWKPVKEFLHATPLYIDEHDMVVCGTNEGYVMALNAKTGKGLWSYQTEGSVKHGIAFDKERGRVYFGSFDGSIYGLDVKDGKEVFKLQTRNIVYATPLIVDHLLYCPSTEKRLYVINLDTCEIHYKYDARSKMYSSPDLLDGVVYWGCNDGTLVGVEPMTQDIKYWTRVAERLLSKPTMDEDGTIFINGAGGTLYAFKRLEAKE